MCLVVVIDARVLRDCDGVELSRALKSPEPPTSGETVCEGAIVRERGDDLWCVRRQCTNECFFCFVSRLRVQKSTKAFTKEPEARERKPRTVEKAKKAPASVTKRTPTKSVAAEDDTAVGGATAKRGRGRPPGTTKAAMAKRTGGGKPEAGAKAGVSRKVSAMAKAAAIAKEGLKRPAKYFESSDRSTSGRKVPKRASESSPGSDGDSPDVFLRRVKTPSEKTPPRGRGRPPASSKLGHAAAAAKEAANRANGILNANEGHIPQSTAWSGAYRMLQTSHEKLQAKYDKLKAQKLQDMLKEADRQQGILLEHERKADELVHHLRSEADRQRDIASRAEGANEKAYSLERENAELRETVLAYQGKMLRMEQELDAKRSNKIDEMQAGASGRDLTSYGLEALTGLRWEPLPRGMHRFTHVSTGFSFQLSAAEDEDHQPCGIDPFQRPKPGDKVAHEITFFPVNEGSIGGAVPPLLADPMDFDTTDMPVFTTKLLQALYNAKIALAQAQTQGASYSRA